MKGKKILTWLLTIVMVLAMFPSTAFAENINFGASQFPTKILVNKATKIVSATAIFVSSVNTFPGVIDGKIQNDEYSDWSTHELLVGDNSRISASNTLRNCKGGYIAVIAWDDLGGIYVYCAKGDSSITYSSKGENKFVVDCVDYKAGVPLENGSNARNGEWHVTKKYVTTTANPTDGGQITNTSGVSGWSDSGGWLDNGSTTEIKAQAKEGYVFTGWSDGVTNAERTITVNGDATYTANFAKIAATDTDGNNYETVAAALEKVTSGTITATGGDLPKVENGTLASGVKLVTKAGSFTAVDGAATISVSSQGGVTLSDGKLSVEGKADVTVTTNDEDTNTVRVTVPEGKAYTVDRSTLPAKVGKIASGDSITLGDITYTAGTYDADFTIGDDRLVNQGDRAMVTNGTDVTIALGEGEDAPKIEGISKNGYTTTITKGSSDFTTPTTVHVAGGGDSFTLAEKTYTCYKDNATFNVYEATRTACLEDGTGSVPEGSSLDVLINGNIVTVTAEVGDLSVKAEGSTAEAYLPDKGDSIIIGSGDNAKTFVATENDTRLTIGSDGTVYVENGAVQFGKNHSVGFTADSISKLFTNTGDEDITVVKGMDDATLTVPAGGEVVIKEDGEKAEYTAETEATIKATKEANTITSGSVYVNNSGKINIGDVAIENTYDGSGINNILVSVSATSKTVAISARGAANIGAAVITDVMQDEVIDLNQESPVQALVALSAGESVTVNDVKYTGAGDDGGSLWIDTKTGKVVKISGSINIEIDEKNLTEKFSYDLVADYSVTIGRYVYTAESGSNLGDVVIKGRGASEDGTNLNPAVVLAANAKVDVALASNKDVVTTYTAANTNTYFVMSADDTDTTKVDLLDNSGDSNSALKFDDTDKHTVNGVTYQAQAATVEEVAYTVTYGTMIGTEGTRVNSNIVRVSAGFKVIATMTRGAGLKVNSGDSDTPYVAANSGAAIQIDNTTGESNVSGRSSSLLPLKNESGEEIGVLVRKKTSDSSGDVTASVSDGDGTMKVKVSVSGSVATVGGITQTELEKLDGDGNVTIDLSGLSNGVTGVKLPVSTLTNVQDSNAEKLEIKLPGADVTIDKTTLNALVEQATADNLSLVVDDDTAARSTLNTAQKRSLSELNEPTVIEAYFVSGDKRISDFKGGTVSVAIELNTNKPIRVWYLKEDGDREKVDASYNNKTATLTLKHFSHYVIEQLDDSQLDDSRVDDSQGYASCTKDETCPIASFTDAQTTAWYHDGVHYCLDNDLMVGTSGSTFSPNSDITRGQIVTILWRLEGSPAASGGSFDDVAADAYYANAVAWAAEHGIVGGYGDGKFGSNDPITREQFAAILYRYAQFKGVDVSVGEDTNIMDYDDVSSISSYAVPAIQWACGSGLMSGVSALTLDPTGVTSRAQAATMLMRYCAEVAK